MARLCSSLRSVVLLALTAAPLLAQSVQPPVSETPATLKVNVRTVVEDVVVFDKNGHAVPGLRKEDFQIFENGKPQAITFFEPNFASAKTTAAPPVALPPGVFTNIPATPSNHVTNVLLLDALNTPPSQGMSAEVQMVKYLASLPPNLRIAVFTLDNEKLHMLWGFDENSSVQAVIAQFAAKHSRSSPLSSAAQQQSEKQELIETVDAIQQTAKNASDDRLGDSADALQHFLKYKTANGSFFTTMNALEALAHYLAGMPGRKNLFWLSGGFPHQFKSDLYFDWYREARDKLAAAGVSVYPIDANGVDVDTGGFLSRFSISRFEASEDWAEETGGKAYHENNINQEIVDAVDHGSCYYTLAYVPTEVKEEGRERKVEIKIASGDYRVFYRKSYFEKTQREIAKAGSAAAKDPLLDLMGRGMPDISEIPYRLKVVPAQLGGKLTRYHVGFHIQAGALSLLPDADGARRKTLEVTLAVYSNDARPLNLESRNIVLLIKPEQWARAGTEGVSFHLDIDAPSGDLYLRTGVYDDSSSKVGTLEVPLSAVTDAEN